MNTDNWFCVAGYFNDEGFTQVKREDGKWGILGADGNIIGGKWFYSVSIPQEGIVRVRLDHNKYSFVNMQGDFICKQTFEYATFCVEGFAIVRTSKGYYHFLGKNGNFLKIDGDFPVVFAHPFHNGFARIEREGDHKWGFLGKDGKILGGMWFESALPFNEGCASVQRNIDEWGLLDMEGNLIGGRWFSMVSDFREGFSVVRRDDGLWGYLDKDGNILCGMWFTQALAFYDGFALVSLIGSDYMMYLDKEGGLHEHR